MLPKSQKLFDREESLKHGILLVNTVKLTVLENKMKLNIGFYERHFKTQIVKHI